MLDGTLAGCGWLDVVLNSGAVVWMFCGMLIFSLTFLPWGWLDAAVLLIRSFLVNEWWYFGHLQVLWCCWFLDMFEYFVGCVFSSTFTFFQYHNKNILYDFHLCICLLRLNSVRYLADWILFWILVVLFEYFMVCYRFCLFVCTIPLSSTFYTSKYSNKSIRFPSWMPCIHEYSTAAVPKLRCTPHGNC